MKTVSEIIDANSTARSYSSVGGFIREQQLNKSMKVKELIEKLQKFDGELEVIVQRYDGIKSYNDFLTYADINLVEDVYQRDYSTQSSKNTISKAIVIEG